MKTFVGVLLWLATACAQTVPEPKPVRWQNPVQDKNFYLLSLLERTPAVARILQDDPALREMAQARREALHTASNCPEDLACLLAPLRFSDAELTRASEALQRLHGTAPPVRSLVETSLRSSGAYVRWHDRSGDALLVAAWLDAARGVNRIIDVYGSGKAPRYAAIDSVSFDVKSNTYRQMVHTAIDLLEERGGELGLFFQAPLRFALRLLELNHRDEAGRLEPLAEGENQAALRRIAALQWESFPYTAIVVPGSGSDRTTWALSGSGRMRCEIAVRRYREGLAPVIVVSGGFVHPNQTPYCEAVEMKRVLIRDFGVPPEAILIDPHSRHTTTNLRNVSRLLFRGGVPVNRKALLVTDRFHSRTIESERFAERCKEELGYVPVRIVGRRGLLDLEFLPLVESLQIDPAEPLDP
jgi:uncharacterized SAM-binding protein YcdF (DUF218 family)